MLGPAEDPGDAVFPPPEPGDEQDVGEEDG